MPRILQARRGVNLIEVLVAAVVAGVVMLALGGFISQNYIAANDERDRAFAMQKAIQILEEVSSYKLKDKNDPGPDTYAKQGLRFELTTAPGVSPGGALSGNPLMGGYYKYVRLVSSEAVPGDEFARKVTVKVWYAEQNASPIARGSKALAVVSGVMRSNVGSVGPRQVIDLYAISIENVPHVYLKQDNHPYDQYNTSASAARASFESALNRLQEQNPWLSFRIHYISRLSIGRDPYYRPYMNEAKPLHGSGRDVLDHVYFYPGLLETGGARYYDYRDVQGNIRVDLPSGIENRGTYPLADQFNHAVRHAQEFDAANSPQPLRPDGTVATQPEDMSLRQFLDDLLTDTSGKYRNGILVNLHGELFPALPLRNYADAAKDPGAGDAITRQRRLVTHPYKLSFAPATERVRLLVHPYFDNGQNMTSSGTPATGRANDMPVWTDWSPAHYARNGRIIIKGLKPYLKDNNFIASDVGTVSARDVVISVIQREKYNNGNNDKTVYTRRIEWPYNYSTGEYYSDLAGLNLNEHHYINGAYTRFPHTGPHVTDHQADETTGQSTKSQMHHVDRLAYHGADPAFSGDDLVIELTDLDYDHRKVDNSGTLYGIDTGSRDYFLHDRQYFPDPFLPFLDVANAGVKPRNTARVIIEFDLKATAVSQGRFEVVTQLMKSPESSGTGSEAFPAATASDPANSRTWFYVGDVTSWDSTRKLYTHIPWTEQVQLVGDPRHNPYHDVRKQGLFNPYFTDWSANKEVYKDIKNDGSDDNKYLKSKNLFSDLAPQTVNGQLVYDTQFAGSEDSYKEVKYNVPAYFRMWREAITRNHMVFVNLAGEPFRYIGLGGEFCLDGTVDGGSELNISSRPWDSATGDANDRADELFSDKTRVIEKRDDQWVSKAWLGEGYPSYEWSTWQSTGSLPSSDASSANYRRERLGDLDELRWSKYTDRSSGKNRKRIKDRVAFASFLNAVNTSGGTPVDVADDGGSNGTQTTTGAQMVDALRLTLESTLKATYSYKIDAGSMPPEWSTAPYDSHGGLDWLLPSAVTPKGYYGHSKGSTYFASAPLLLKDSLSSPTKGAVVVANSYRAESANSVGKLLEAGTSAMLEAFYDGTRHAIGSFNIKPLPRVKLKTPRSGESLAGNAVALEWYAKWSKANGQDYSTFFSDTFSPLPAPSAGGPLDIVYFVKYRDPAGAWKTARLSVPSSASVATTVGVPVNDTGVALIPNVNYPGAIAATWDIAGLANGQYMLRVEGFRTTNNTDRSKTIGTHASYHEIPVEINH